MPTKTPNIEEKNVEQNSKIEAKIVECKNNKETENITENKEIEAIEGKNEDTETIQTETKTESKEPKKSNLAITLLWFGCFILLVVVCAVLLYLRHSLIKNNSKQNIIDIQAVNIFCSNTILDVGETLEVEIANSKDDTILLTDKPEIIGIEGNKITALRRGRSCNICNYWGRKKQ